MTAGAHHVTMVEEVVQASHTQVQPHPFEGGGLRTRWVAKRVVNSRSGHPPKYQRCLCGVDDLLQGESTRVARSLARSL